MTAITRRKKGKEKDKEVLCYLGGQIDTSLYNRYNRYGNDKYV